MRKLKFMNSKFMKFMCSDWVDLLCNKLPLYLYEKDRDKEYKKSLKLK